MAGPVITTTFAGESAQFLSAVEQSRGGLRRLLAELAPAAAATDRFNKSQEQLDTALKRGRITIDQHAEVTRRLKSSYEQQQRTMTGAIATNGAARAGMQQLSYQIGDVATQFALGARPSQIFAAQIGQVVGAVQLMTGGTSKLANFLGGPWGIAVTAATIVLTPMVAKLFEGEDAAKAMDDALAEVADGADAFGDAQAMLGRVIDLTTGKMEAQVETMRAMIRYTAELWKIQGRDRQEALANELSATGERRVGGFASTTPGGTGLGQFTPSRAANPQLQGFVRMVTGGMMHDADQATKALVRLKDQGAVTEKQFIDLGKRVNEYFQAIDKEAAGQALTDALDGNIDPRFRKDGPKTRPKKPPKDRSAEIQARFEAELQGLLDEQIADELAITTDLERRRELQADLIKSEYEQRVAQIENEKDYSQKQKAALIELLRKRYGVREDDKSGDIVVDEGSAYTRKRDNEFFDAQLAERVRLQQGLVSVESEVLDGELDAARTQADRRRIQLELLAKEMELRKLAAEAVLAKSDSTAAEKKIAQATLDRLGEITNQRTASIERSTLAPLADYMERMPKTAEELNEAYQQVAVDGLKSLNDGLVEAIMNSKSLGDVFHNISNQIIADLLRIAVQKNITEPLANMLGGLSLFGGGGGGGNISAGSVSAISSIGHSLPGHYTGLSMRIGGNPGIDQNLLSINHRPIGWVSDTERLTVKPANDRGGMAGGDAGTFVFDMRGAVVTEDLLAQMNAIAQSTTAQGLSGARRIQVLHNRQTMA